MIAAYLSHHIGPAGARPGSFGLIYGLMQQQAASSPMSTSSAGPRYWPSSAPPCTWLFKKPAEPLGAAARRALRAILPQLCLPVKGLLRKGRQFRKHLADYSLCNQTGANLKNTRNCGYEFIHAGRKDPFSTRRGPRSEFPRPEFPQAERSRRRSEVSEYRHRRQRQPEATIRNSYIPSRRQAMMC